MDIPIDEEPPSVTCPSFDAPLETDPGKPTAELSATVTVLDAVDGNPSVVCTDDKGAVVTPEAFTRFNVGLTNVTCVATDMDRNSGNCSFLVEVFGR